MRRRRLGAVRGWGGAVLALALGGCGWYAPFYERAAPPRQGGGIYHVVERGQTLWRISRTYGVDMEEIAVLNGINNPDRLLAGARLFIPGATRALYVPTRGGPPAPKERPNWAVAEEPPDRKYTPSYRNRKLHFSWPVHGKLIQHFGSKNGVKYDGIVISAHQAEPVRAAAAGQVIFSDWGPGGYGRTIIIRHGNGEYHSVYAHNAVNLVKKGDIVRGGGLIARVGRSGNVDHAQLHFEIRHRTIPQDPLSYLP